MWKIKIKKRRSKLMQSFNEVSSPFGLWALVAFQLQKFRIYNSILFHGRFWILIAKTLGNNAGYLLGMGHVSSTVHPCNQILDASTWIRCGCTPDWSHTSKLIGGQVLYKNSIANRHDPTLGRTSYMKFCCQQWIPILKFVCIFVRGLWSVNTTPLHYNKFY